MADTHDQAQFRQHLAEMRKAAAGLGHDFKNEFSDLDQKIERLGQATAKDAKYLALDIQDELANVGRAVDQELRNLPHHIANAGAAIGSGTARAAGAARDAVVTAGKHAKEGAKNAFAAAAGVKRTPMRVWTAPSSGETAGHDESKDEST